jgi:hypothetical protein
MRGRLGAIASAASMTGRGSLPLARAGRSLSWLAVAGPNRDFARAEQRSEGVAYGLFRCGHTSDGQ